METHHGVLDVWASKNVPGYVSRSGKAPTVALMPAQHDATKAVYRDWLRAPTGRPVGGSVDWTSVTSPDVHELSERMFDAVGVSSGVRNDYYSQFNSYLYGLG